MPTMTPQVPSSLRRYLFERDMLATVAGGKSAIDMPRLGVRSHDQARSFLQRYGFDTSIPTHRAALERLRSDAIGFCRGVLLADLDLDVPPAFDEMDPLQIIVLTGNIAHGAERAAQLEAAWACSLLRVMHTFAHAENYFQQAYYPQIRAAILERFIDQVRTEEDGSQVLVGRTCDVPLLRFEVKEAKPIRSVVLKLLQKEENVAYDLFDHIGVRIVVDRPVDALFVVRALVEEHTVIFPNIKPTRSRNTLIDTEALASHVEAMIDAYSHGDIDESAALHKLSQFAGQPQSEAQTEWNPHSSNSYSSIQFTCRQMIRIPNPLYERLEAAAALARETLDGQALGTMLGALSTVDVEREIQFFFPYEVQIMDKASNDAATVGRASYREYKSRQVDTVRRRVLGRVLELNGTDDRSLNRSRFRTTADLKSLREMMEEAGLSGRG